MPSRSRRASRSSPRIAPWTAAACSSTARSSSGNDDEPRHEGQAGFARSSGRSSRAHRARARVRMLTDNFWGPQASLRRGHPWRLRLLRMAAPEQRQGPRPHQLRNRRADRADRRAGTPRRHGAADGVSTIDHLWIQSGSHVGVLVQSNTAVEIVRSKIRALYGGRAGHDGKSGGRAARRRGPTGCAARTRAPPPRSPGARR